MPAEPASHHMALGNHRPRPESNNCTFHNKNTEHQITWNVILLRVNSQNTTVDFNFTARVNYM